MTSLIRDNLMSRPNYTPYCGNNACRLNMPRTHFKDNQFQCNCGWKSEFDQIFINQYLKYRKTFNNKD